MKRLLWLVTLLSGVAHANTVTYVYTDPQGTPLAEANASGTITATYDYAPYGSQAMGAAHDGPGYTGHVNDADTGLVYMQARYYDPVVGRFVSTDPVGPSAGNVFNFNRYAYANNNPIANTDPTGRQICNYDKGVCEIPPNSFSAGNSNAQSASNSNHATTEATNLAPVVVMGSAIEAAATSLGSRALWVGGLTTLGASLFVMDANGIHDMIYGRQGCYGSFDCGHGIVFSKRPPGFIDAEKGAEEWGRKQGIGAAKGRRKFHDIKQGDSAHKGGKQDWGVNPHTGDVSDPEGEIHGNLGEG
jgi:RHS repeat-associated protein